MLGEQHGIISLINARGLEIWKLVDADTLERVPKRDFGTFMIDKAYILLHVSGFSFYCKLLTPIPDSSTLQLGRFGISPSCVVWGCR